MILPGAGLDLRQSIAVTSKHTCLDTQMQWAGHRSGSAEESLGATTQLCLSFQTEEAEPISWSPEEAGAGPGFRVHQVQIHVLRFSTPPSKQCPPM